MEKFTIITFIILFLMTIGWMIENSHLLEKHVLVTGGSLGERYYGVEEKKKGGEDAVIHFDLVDPESAPEVVLTKILYGYHLMLDTKKNAPEYARNAISCNNCHFSGGNTLGGRNRGISLVGVTAVYPRFSKRDGKNISLADRISNCFKRSLDGKAPAEDSMEMESLIAYLTWISHEIANAPSFPWLGLDQVPLNQHEANASKGEGVYTENCASCHGTNGEGSERVPPLWGKNSFNDGAGMNTMAMLSSFVWYNMPYGQPTLTPEEALDVAAYIISKPRPHFEKK